MIHYSIVKLRESGVTDILLVISAQSASLYADYLGGGRGLGVKLTYRIQEEAAGVADALSLAEGFVRTGEKMIVLLGDNLFEDSLLPDVAGFMGDQEGAKVFVKEIEDPRMYGVPVFNGEGGIVRIEEKPEHPPTSYCVTGIYMYGSEVFDRIRKLKPSPRGEYEITDVNNMYAAEGKLSCRLLEGWWTDAGTFSSLYEANKKFGGFKE
jgi:glucose-1-phosphate thymidylyltransferase